MFKNDGNILNCLRKSTTAETQIGANRLQLALLRVFVLFLFCLQCAAIYGEPEPLSKVLANVDGGTLFGVKMKKHVMAVYGNTSLERGYCNHCKGMTIIKRGKYSCCDRLAEGMPTKFERVSSPPAGRKTPSMADKRRILTQQSSMCFYCFVELGSTRFRHGLAFNVKVEWDHLLPFAYSQNNATENFVAACHVCNGIKSSRIFKTVEEAQVFIADRRKSKGYDF